jgi:hypothetical protein
VDEVEVGVVEAQARSEASQAARMPDGVRWSCQTLVVTKSASRDKAEAATAAPMSASLPYISAVSMWR